MKNGEDITRQMTEARSQVSKKIAKTKKAKNCFKKCIN